MVTQSQRIAERLHGDGALPDIVHSKIVGGDTRRNNKMVILQFAIGKNNSILIRQDVQELSHPHRNTRMLAKHLPEGIRYIGWLEKTGCYLIKHRWEEAIVIAVYQGNPELFIFGETIYEVHTGEPAADH